MRNALLILTAAPLLSACLATGTPVELQPQVLGGSRADGFVVIGDTWRHNEIATVPEGVGAAAAQSTCKGWGYVDATPVAETTQRCIERHRSVCLAFEASRRYQCVTDAAPS